LSRVGCAAALAVLIAGAASAEEVAVAIRKVEDGKITFTEASLTS